IVNEDQVVESPMSGERTRLGGDAFLHVTIAAEADHVLVEDSVLIGVEARCSHLCRHRDADRVANALAEWPGRAFYARCIAKLRVARRLGMQLPEPFDLRHRQVVA